MDRIRIEKRLPYGFTGKWGRLYKMYAYDDNSQVVDNEVITYMRKNYVELGMDLQYKLIQDKSKVKDALLVDYIANTDKCLVETTDAFFNNKTKEFDCVIFLDDIVYLEKEYWLVEHIQERRIFTPRTQSFYYIALKRIDKEIINAKE